MSSPSPALTWSEFTPPSSEQWLELVKQECSGRVPRSRSWEGLEYPLCGEPRWPGETAANDEGAPELVLESPSAVDLRQCWQEQHWQVAEGAQLSSHGWLQWGVDAVHELAWTIAGWVEVLRHSSDPSGLRLGAGPRLLIEIAKFRAARRLAQTVTQALELPTPPTLHLFQDGRWHTRQDPHNNLLRTSLSMLAGFLGGAASLQPLPLDNSPEAIRWAANVVHLLRLESGLGSHTDPLRGSGLIEELTEQMAEKAWAEVQRIEAAGGLARQSDLEQRAALQRGAFETLLAEDAQGLVGVNRYVAPQVPAEYAVAGLRWATGFEELHAKGQGRRVAVAVVGPDSALLKARQAYVEQWLAMAGLQAQVERHPEWPADRSFDEPWVLCSEDSLWSTLLAQQPTVLAGKPPDGWNGLAVYRGCNRLDVLQQLLEKLA